MSEETGAEQRLIEAAIECIEAYGVQGATTQRIAERAGVHHTSINYYFRSKEQLIRRALAVTLRNAFCWEDFAESEGYDARERLVHILTTLIQGAHKYPGISRAHISETVLHRNYDTPAIRQLNAFLGELEQDLCNRDPSLAGNELKMALSQIMGCAFLYGALAPGFFNGYSGMDLTDAETTERFVRRLVDRLL